jgi:cytochrome c oxidase subunit 2
MRDQTSGTSLKHVTPTSPSNLVRAAKFAALAIAGSVLAGCAEHAPQDTFAPEGQNARDIDTLSRAVFSIAGIVGLITFSAIGYAIWKYRDRGQPIPEQTHGKPALEIGLTILPALIVIGVAFPRVGTFMALSETDDSVCMV